MVDILCPSPSVPTNPVPRPQPSKAFGWRVLFTESGVYSYEPGRGFRHDPLPRPPLPKPEGPRPHPTSLVSA